MHNKAGASDLLKHFTDVTHSLVEYIKQLKIIMPDILKSFYDMRELHQRMLR